jgi:TPR repeat protein
MLGPKAGGAMGQGARDAEGDEVGRDVGRDVDVMIEQGNLLLEHGDLDGAEAWYRRAAAGGHTGAMHNLGFVLGEKGDLDGAEDWFRQAAAGGHVSSMSNLGSVLEEKGDREGAEAWYLQAARGGNAYAMSNLGLLLAERGDARDATMWYRRAATMGNTGAMHNLGCLLKGVGDLDGAEEWFRYSVDGGNTPSMISLGLLYQDRGDLDAATGWFRRAASAGVTEGTANLHDLQRKMDSDPDLEKITFDTFGWALSRNRVRFRQWRTGDTSLTQRFFERPPDFASWDADHIRDELEATLSLVQSPTRPIDGLDLPEWFGRHRPTVWPEHILLLDVDCFEIGPARCVLATTRHRLHETIHYSTGIFVLFNQCYWLLQLQVEEGDDVGEREGAVAQRILNRNAAADTPIDLFDPYDRQWDGIVPIEDDPLTRMRVLVTRLRDSIRLNGGLAALEPFAPGGRGRRGGDPHPGP